MTRGEYDAKPIKAGPATISHKFLIERAMAKGKTIPAEVLADYPKLAEKVNQKAPESPKTIPDLQEALQVGIDSKTVPLKDAGVLVQSLVGAFKSSELAIKDRIEYAKNLENEFLALNKVTKESLDKMSASQKAELQNKFYDWVEKYYPHFKFERTKIGQDSKLKTIPDLQEALQAGKITKAEFDKQVEEIRSVQPKDKFH